MSRRHPAGAVEDVAADQRRRIVVAVAEIAAAEGFAVADADRISRGAGVSKRDLYRHFGGHEACWATATASVAAEIDARVTRAYGAERLWPAAIRAALAALIELLARDPVARALLVAGEPPSGDRVLACLEPLLRAGRGVARADRLPAATEAAVIGGLGSLLGPAIAGEGDGIEAALPQVVEFALTPYLGATEARRVAGDARRPPEDGARSRTARRLAGGRSARATGGRPLSSVGERGGGDERR